MFTREAKTDFAIRMKSSSLARTNIAPTESLQPTSPHQIFLCAISTSRYPLLLKFSVNSAGIYLLVSPCALGLGRRLLQWLPEGSKSLNLLEDKGSSFLYTQPQKLPFGFWASLPGFVPGREPHLT